MEDSRSEISCTSAGDRRQAAVDELLHGQHLTQKLMKGLLAVDADHHHDHQPPPSAEDLLGEVLESFNKIISMLSCDESSAGGLGSPATTMKSEDSEESCRTGPIRKDGRGSYKRRRSAETWSELTTALVDDGHAWRKYGQKSILNSDFPRSYFRCTHKYDQGCQATKQVQRISTDPPMYKTVYIARHTCKSLFHSPPIVVESLPEPADTSSFFLSFDGSCNNDINHVPFPRESSPPRNSTSTSHNVSPLPDQRNLQSPCLDSEHWNMMSSSRFVSGFDDVLLHGLYQQ